MANLTVIGLGLIGGSFAKSIRSSKIFENIYGVDNNPLHCKKAIELVIVDSCLELNAAVDKSDFIVLAVPVDIAPQIAANILDLVKDQTLIDVGSTKKEILQKLKDHPKRSQFVATHPMAGTEYSGPEAALEGLFNEKICIVCQSELSDSKRVEQVIEIYQKMGSEVKFMDGDQHDISAAYVSHISHISSFALALTVLNKEKNQENITTLASGGFRSTVRLAKSNQDTWEAIFSQNRENVLEVIDNYIENMILFKHAIKSGNSEVVKTLIRQANKVKKVL